MQGGTPHSDDMTHTDASYKTPCFILWFVYSTETSPSKSNKLQKCPNSLTLPEIG